MSDLVVKKSKAKDLTGMGFGKLTVVSKAENKWHGKQVKTMWNCICECGGKTISASGNLMYAHTKSCGCSHRRKGEENHNWQGCGDVSGSFFAQIRTGASQRGWQLEITVEHIWELLVAQNHTCALTGLPIFLSTKRRRDKEFENTASLDRIDSKEGYIEGNVQWVHKDVNLMKNNLEQEYFINMCKKITEYAR